MADFPVGASGTLRIVDDGTNVAFYVLCSDPATNKDPYTGAIFINGVNHPFSVDLDAGFGSRLLRIETVTYSQSVGIAQNATGTIGLGGAASFSVDIVRATVPPAPTPLGVSLITQTTCRYQFSSNGLGSGTFLRWEAQWSTSPTFATGNGPIVTSSGTTDFTDLPPGTTLYFRSRGVNTHGNGAWSAIISATTLPSGARVGAGGSFVLAATSVGKSSAFVPTQILVGKGGSFLPPA